MLLFLTRRFGPARLWALETTYPYPVSRIFVIELSRYAMQSVLANGSAQVGYYY